MAAKVVCISNLKGGVGKTTLTMALAEYLAGNIYSKRVLVVDLDPQCNLTSAMMDEKSWAEFEKNVLTLPYLFKHPDCFLHTYKNDEFIAKSGISNLRNNNSFECLHFIASSPVLFEIQEDLTDTSYFFTDLRAVDLLKELFKPILDNYDYILIDCPPTLNKTIKSAFLASQFCLIPCVPNQMSMNGMKLVLKHIEKVNQTNDHNLKAAGIIISRYNGTLAQTEFVTDIRENPLYPQVLNTKIPEKSKVAQALDARNKLTYKQKYGESNQIMCDLTEEFIQKVG